MLKFIKSIFVKSAPVVAPVEPAKGVIARAESELFIITLEHKGGDHFEIFAVGKLTKSGSGCYRHGETRARSQYAFYCSLHGAK